MHDNVPIVAGVMASAFLSWWTTQEDLLEGFWTLPLDNPWPNMLALGENEGEVEEMVAVPPPPDMPEETTVHVQPWVTNYRHALELGRVIRENARGLAGSRCDACNILIALDEPITFWFGPGTVDGAIHRHEEPSDAPTPAPEIMAVAAAIAVDEVWSGEGTRWQAEEEETHDIMADVVEAEEEEDADAVETT